MVFGREPVVWAGIIASVILAIVSTLLGQGVISDALAGKITDIVHAVLGVLVLLIPVIAAVFARPKVTPAKAPIVQTGVTIQVTNAEGEFVNRLKV